MTVEEWLYQYVPHREADRYRQMGWEIYPLLGKHGVWSVLAVVRVVRMDEQKKFCKNCKHFSYDWEYPDLISDCNSPQVQSLDPVWGKLRSAKAARSDHKSCGPKGLYWEPHEPKKPKEKKRWWQW